MIAVLEWWFTVCWTQRVVEIGGEWRAGDQLVGAGQDERMARAALLVSITSSSLHRVSSISNHVTEICPRRSVPGL